MNFQPRQLVFKYGGCNEIKEGKFKVRWLGSIKIQEVSNNKAIKLENLDGTLLKDIINGSKLKPYKERRGYNYNQHGGLDNLRR